MKERFRNMSRIKKILLVVVALGGVSVLGLAILIGLRLLTGQPLGFGLWRVKRLALVISDRSSVTANNRGEFTNVIFLHHSTGGNLIKEGNVRELFTEAGFDFWDHGYNLSGLTGPDGIMTGYSYMIPDDNTDPDGWVKTFAQPVYSLPLNALSGMLQHEVIIFKSCFPASNITSDEQLEQYKVWYLGMRDVMDTRLDRIFVVMSPPPLHPAATTPEAAARARAFADWLGSDEYLDGHPNVYVFDFFGHLAEEDPTSPEVNMLRAAYRRETTDSHPNQVANEAAGPLFVDAVIQAASSYREYKGWTSQ